MTVEEIIVYFVAPVVGYLVGAVPFGFLIGKMHGVDIRTVGSKNIGATNLGRTLGKKYFWQAFILDAAKGFLPVLAVAVFLRHYNAHIAELPVQNFVIVPGQVTGPLTPWAFLPSWAPLLTAVACVLGHNFPVWLKFKGGKGVSTSFGAVLGFWPLYTVAAIFAGLVFVFVLMVYRYISLASILGVLSFVGFVAIFGRMENLFTFLKPSELNPLIGVAALFAGLIVFRHKANIVRLLKGTEPQVGEKQVEKAKMK